MKKMGLCLYIIEDAWLNPFFNGLLSVMNSHVDVICRTSVRRFLASGTLNNWTKYHLQLSWFPFEPNYTFNNSNRRDHTLPSVPLQWNHLVMCSLRITGLQLLLDSQKFMVLHQAILFSLFEDSRFCIKLLPKLSSDFILMNLNDNSLDF